MNDLRPVTPDSSMVEFVDERRLGLAFRFYHRHRILDEDGRLLGYRNLDDLRTRLKPLLLRRTRAMVMRELPKRSTQIVRITPTDEQLALHEEYMRIVGQIVSKPYLTRYP